MKFLLKDEDVGHVELNLRPDSTFYLRVKIIITAQIEIEGGENDDIEGIDENYTGKWKVENDSILLLFNENTDLKKLFNPRLDPYNTTQIIDNKTVVLNKESELITIRGVYCSKT